MASGLGSVVRWGQYSSFACLLRGESRMSFGVGMKTVVGRWPRTLLDHWVAHSPTKSRGRPILTRTLAFRVQRTTYDVSRQRPTTNDQGRPCSSCTNSVPPSILCLHP